MNAVERREAKVEKRVGNYGKCKRMLGLKFSPIKKRNCLSARIKENTRRVEKDIR
jgi:hypothetical protein